MRFLNILKQIEIEEKNKRKKRKKKNKAKSNSKLKLFIHYVKGKTLNLVIRLITPKTILSVCGLLFVFSLVLLGFYGKNNISFVSLALVYLLIYLLNFYWICIGAKGLCKQLYLPYGSAINANIKRSYYLDKKYLGKLLECSIKQLKVGEIELNNEHLFLIKRIHLVVGPLEKLGLLPGLISAISILPQVEGFWASNWISAIGYAYIILMPLSFGFHTLVARYERMIALTQLAIKIKESDNN